VPDPALSWPVSAAEVLIFRPHRCERDAVGPALSRYIALVVTNEMHQRRLQRLDEGKRVGDLLGFACSCSVGSLQSFRSRQRPCPG